MKIQIVKFDYFTEPINYGSRLVYKAEGIIFPKDNDIHPYRPEILCVCIKNKNQLEYIDFLVLESEDFNGNLKYTSTKCGGYSQRPERRTDIKFIREEILDDKMAESVIKSILDTLTLRKTEDYLRGLILHKPRSLS